MTGIAGLMTRDGSSPAPASLQKLLAALRHRGPDEERRYGAGGIGIVEARLGIDLVTGKAPLGGAGGAALAADGAIYNQVELLEQLGRPQPDCALPLSLYRRWGLDFPAQLRGMYALALYDPASRTLVLARDPFGIKPLYYSERTGTFAFASEAGALVEAGIVPPVSVPSVRNELLQMQFTTGRETIFAGIDRVLPGETVIVRQGRIVERRHRPALPEFGPLALGEADALARFDAALTESVALHRRSSVPIGVSLADDADAAGILARLAAPAEHPLPIFTLGFLGAETADGFEARRITSAAVGAEHVELALDEADFWRLLPQIVDAVDDPVADSAIVPTWVLADAAQRAGLRVILSGEGADELFAGYGHYRSVGRRWWLGGRMPRIRGLLDDLGVLRGEIAGWRDGIAAAEARCGGRGRTALQVAQAVDCADWLPNDPLNKLDRCLMAHSVEGRTPYLDVRLAALALRLPDALKIQHGFGKWLLRRSLAECLPQAQPFARRRFRVPVGEWLAHRAGAIGPLVAHAPAVRELCRPEAVEALFAAASQRRAGRAAWTLLFYALWHRRHIERMRLPPDTIAALADAR